jgi:hypothetical protein
VGKHRPVVEGAMRGRAQAPLSKTFA